MSSFPRVRIVNVTKGAGVIPGRSTRVYVDDVEITRCVHDVQISSPLKDVVTATISVLVNAVEFEGGVSTTVPPQTHDTLIALGWTPPAVDLEASS